MLSRCGVEPCGEALLPHRAHTPGARGLRVVRECEQKPAEAWVRLAYTVLTALVTAVELAARGGSCGTSTKPNVRTGCSAMGPAPSR